MNNKLLTALEDCLQAIQEGADPQTVLARYPDLADELRPLLESAQDARQFDQSPVSPKTINRGRDQLLAQVREARKKQRTRMAVWPFRRLPFAIALVLVVMVLAGTGLVTVSASSLPGDPLYGIKRTSENVQLQLAFSPSQKAALQDEFSVRRIDEAESLLASKRVEQVEFSGVVQAQLPDGWLVSGIHVILNTQTRVTGVILPGAGVEISGFTQANGSLLADSLTVESSSPEENGGDANAPGSGSGQGEVETPQIEPTQDTGPVSTPTPGETRSSEGGGGGEWGGSATPQSTSGGDHEDYNSTAWPSRTPGPTATPGPSGTPGSTQTQEPTD